MTRKDDNRRHDRFSAEDVHGEFSYSVQARVLNISLGGLAVRTQTQLKIGRKYRFRLGAHSKAVQLEGSVRWCRLSGTERQESGDIVPVYEAGISFDDVLTDKAEELLQFMEKNIVLDLRKRISGRFTVDEANSLDLESHSGFEVKQISLSGMMIETEVATPPGTIFELEMRLGRKKFASAARIVYMSEIESEAEDGDEKARLYRMGVEFMRTPEDKRAVLEAFIRTELDREEGRG